MKFKTIISTTIIASLITSAAFADNIGRQGKFVPIYNSTLSVPYTTALHGTVDYSVMLPQGVSKVVTITVAENDVKSYGLKDCMMIANVSANVVSAEVEFVPQQLKCEYTDKGKTTILSEKLSATITTTDNKPVLGDKSATLFNKSEYPYITLNKDTAVNFHLLDSLYLS